MDFGAAEYCDGLRASGLLVDGGDGGDDGDGGARTCWMGRGAPGPARSCAPAGGWRGPRPGSPGRSHSNGCHPSDVVKRVSVTYEKSLRYHPILYEFESCTYAQSGFILFFDFAINGMSKSSAVVQYTFS